MSILNKIASSVEKAPVTVLEISLIASMFSLAYGITNADEPINLSFIFISVFIGIGVVAGTMGIVKKEKQQVAIVKADGWLSIILAVVLIATYLISVDSLPKMVNVLAGCYGIFSFAAAAIGAMFSER
jgi:hypothetical protein